MGRDLPPSPGPEADDSPTTSDVSLGFTPKVGLLIDVLDTVGKWLPATVVEVSGSAVLIHYRFWPCNFDEVIDWSSPRIAPFGTHTCESSSSMLCSGAFRSSLSPLLLIEL